MRSVGGISCHALRQLEEMGRPYCLPLHSISKIPGKETLDSSNDKDVPGLSDLSLKDETFLDHARNLLSQLERVEAGSMNDDNTKTITSISKRGERDT